MKKQITVAVLAIVLGISMNACSKQDQQAVPKEPMQSAPMAKPSDLAPAAPAPSAAPASPSAGMPAGPMGAPHGPMGKKDQKTVTVPDEVKKTWGKVRLVVMDRKTQKSKEFTAALGATADVPDTGLKIAVGEFLPDFKMTDAAITSGSNEPKNPAVRVEVIEKGQSIFKGWLYSKFPEIHPFEHPQYGLALKEGVKK